MTDPQDHELGPERDPYGAAPVARQGPDPASEPTRHVSPSSDVRPAAPTQYGDGTSRRGDDLFGPGTGGTPAGPTTSEPAASAPAGDPEESTVAVPPRPTVTGPTAAFTPEQGGRPSPPPPPPPGRPPAGGYGPPTQQLSPEMQAWARQQRQVSQQHGPGPDPRFAPPPWNAAPQGPPQQHWTGPPPPGQRPPGPPLGRPGPPDPGHGPWGETSGGWPGEGFHGGAGPADFSYTDSIRSSDLVPTRKLPPGTAGARRC